jgi:hypothetical protein
LFAAALLALSRSGLEAGDDCESLLNNASAPCHKGLAKIVNNATTAANVTTVVIRPISAIAESAIGFRGSSGTCSGRGANS